MTDRLLTLTFANCLEQIRLHRTSILVLNPRYLKVFGIFTLRSKFSINYDRVAGLVKHFSHADE